MRLLPSTLLATALLGTALAWPAQAAATLSGTAFEDANRNGVLDAGEAVRSGDALYLFDASGNAVATTTTGSDGRYAFSGLGGGPWSVGYTATAWWSLRNDRVPTTTGSLEPRRTVAQPAAGVDFGWRPIVRSTTPVTTFTGPQGLRVESYDDVVPAQDLYDAVLRGDVGVEASSVVVRFDSGSSSTTTTTVGSAGGRYTTFSAVVYVTYASWLDNGDDVLSHEYGHAWSLYRAHLVQQDPTFAGYLQARGLTGDARVGSSYEWMPRELVAEDYRQLLGSPSARTWAQTNREIPAAAVVPGLADYLRGAFSNAAPAPSPTASSSPSPTASPAPSASPSPTASPAPSATASPTPAPARSKGSCRKGC